MFFTKVSVLVPTRGRVERLKTLLKSFHRTSKPWLTSELVFRVDDDDLETKTFLQTTGWNVLIGPRLDGYRSMSAFLNEAAEVAEGDVLMVGNDDMIFGSKNWDEEILLEANRYPDGLFNIGVETHNADHYPFSVVSKDVVERLGFIYDPRLFWGDIFLRDVMAYFGRTVRLSHVRIDHDWAGNKPDEVFLAASTLKVSNSVNGQVYWERHNVIVKEAVERLKETHLNRTLSVGVSA